MMWLIEIFARQITQNNLKRSAERLPHNKRKARNSLAIANSLCMYYIMDKTNHGVQ